MTIPQRTNPLDRWLARNGHPDELASSDERREFFASMPAHIKQEWHLRKARIDCESPGYNATLVDRAKRRMERVDAMIAFLIDTVRHAEYPNGQARFKINKPARAKQNPVNQADDYYYVPRANR